MVFVLSRPHGTVRATGREASFTDTDDAVEALRTGTARAVVGAIGFDATGPAALTAPTTLHRSSQPIRGRAASPRHVTSRTDRPGCTEHRERVRKLIGHIRNHVVDKVVLARTVDLTVTPAVDVTALINAFAYGNAEHNAFAVDIGDDRWLLGASPELLLRKHGDRVTCRPYAGSAPRSVDPDADRAAAEALAASSKDRAEHAFVVDYLRDRLAPICSSLDVPTRPEVRATGEVWHLATPIEGVLRDATISALDLALLLNPTPAVCGTPGDVAASLIDEIEGDRGLYAGTVGWCDGAGDGEWMVAIRCLQLAADRHSLRTWAGGGIVAQSDPQAELDETSAKLRTVLNALGVGAGTADSDG